MKIQTLKLSELNPAKYNPRKELRPGDAEFEKLKRSIESFGYVELIVVNEATGFTVISGHQRLSVLNALGYESVECVVVSLDAVHEKALNIAMNKISGEWDTKKLENLLSDLKAEDFDVTLTGFDTSEIGLILGIDDEIVQDIVPDAALDEEPVCQPGDIRYHGMDIYDASVDVSELRRDVGMVFQKPTPFPMSVYDNVAYGPRTHGVKSKVKLDDIVERALTDAAIWDEVKDRLKKSALGLSGGQQQRLCIARALAVEPQVLLMDEPTSALDPISTSKIEDLAAALKNRYTIIIVTHNMQQAVRISDNTAFFLLGELIEYGNTEKMFSDPEDKRTEDYITGRFG